MAKLTKAQKGLVRCVKAMDARYMTLDDARRYGVEADFVRARRAGLIRSAGFEASSIGDDFLNSPAGREALEASNG
ncbi:hypothetical protein [Aquamicrobium soli]|uniref:Uncharacterized protein n=1 Tax=Aquamicrobium soli TaxID=1811518 RepID=A0ABV7KCE5_9HYPH